MVLKLHTIIGSTRPGRVAPTIAAWFHEVALAHGGFEAELVDLADFNLPLFDEPKHPRLADYTHDHTKAWSASVSAADAFVFVAPEYNHGPAPALLNALNFLHAEWAKKPAAFVSYGGLAGGARAVEATKLVLTTLEIVPIVPGVMAPMFPNFLDAERRFVANDGHVLAAHEVLDDLLRWAAPLKAMRQPAAG